MHRPQPGGTVLIFPCTGVGKGTKVAPDMRILLLTPRFPFPVVGGDKNRIVDMARVLARRHELVLVSFEERPGMAQAMTADERALFAHVETVPFRKTVMCAGLARWPFCHDPLQVLYYRSPEMRRTVSVLCAERPFDAAICQMIRMAQYLDLVRAPRRIVEMTDAISLNYARAGSSASLRAAVYRLERPRLLQYELACIRRFEASVVVSDVDRQYLLEHDPALAPRLHTIMIGVHTERFDPPASTYDPDLIVFFGNMRSEQNKDAAEFFANEILPLIQARRPTARCEIIGRTDETRPLRIGHRAGVVVKGWTTAIREEVQRACLTVCPMRFGAGIQYKVLESLAMAVPCVTTQIGFEGLRVDPRRDLVVADGVEAFADAVLRVMGDPHLREQLAANGRAAVHARHRWDVLLEPYETLLAGDRIRE